MTHTITHTQHTKDFDAGFKAKSLEIKEMGLAASLSKFNAENPAPAQYSNLGAYYYAKGEFEAIFQATR